MFRSTAFGTINLSKGVYDKLNKLRVHRPDIVVNEWNERNPISTELAIVLDDGSVKQIKTCSEAWIVSGTPVVIIEGITGGYLLIRVTDVWNYDK